jgi:methylase of polypeptide subunit release factors
MNTDIKRFRTGGPRNLVVYYTQEMDGGGMDFGQEYVTVIQQRWPGRVFARCYEWCSGPGFIGYALLDYGVCQTVCFSDLYDPAVEMARWTSRLPINNCESQVTAYLFRDLALMPDHEQFDLVVANPPHNPAGDRETLTRQHNTRIEQDPEWAGHQNFFCNIKQHLTADGVILLQLNAVGSDPETFRPWIESAGLRIVDTFASPSYNLDNEFTKIYYLEITHQ